MYNYVPKPCSTAHDSATRSSLFTGLQPEPGVPTGGLWRRQAAVGSRVGCHGAVTRQRASRGTGHVRGTTVTRRRSNVAGRGGARDREQSRAERGGAEARRWGRVVPGRAGSHRVASGRTESRRVARSRTGSHGVVPGRTESYWAAPRYMTAQDGLSAEKNTLAKSVAHC